VWFAATCAVLATALTLTLAWQSPITLDEAASLRVTGIEKRPLESVESHTAGEWVELITTPSDAGETIRRMREEDVHPPLYFIALAGYRHVFGSHVFVTRMLSVVGGLLLIYGAWRLMRDVAPRYAVAATGLLALSNVFISQAANLRAYSFAMAFVVLAAVAARRCAHSDDRSAIVPAAKAGLWAGLAFTGHYFSIFCTGPLLAWATWRRILRADYRSGAAALGSFVPFFAFSAWVVSAQLGSRPDQLTGLDLGVLAVWLAKGYGWMLWGPGPNAIADTGLKLAALVSGAIVVGAGTLLSLKSAWKNADERRDWAFVFALGAACAVGVTVLSVASNKTLFYYRYTAMSAPFSILLVGWGLGYLKDVRPNLGRLTWGLTVAGLVAGGAYLAMRGPTSFWGYRAVAEEIGGLTGRPAILAPVLGTTDDTATSIVALAHYLPEDQRLVRIVDGAGHSRWTAVLEDAESIVVLRPYLWAVSPEGNAETRRYLERQGWRLRSESDWLREFVRTSATTSLPR